MNHQSRLWLSPRTWPWWGQSLVVGVATILIITGIRWDWEARTERAKRELARPIAELARDALDSRTRRENDEFLFSLSERRLADEMARLMRGQGESDPDATIAAYEALGARFPEWYGEEARNRIEVLELRKRIQQQEDAFGAEWKPVAEVPFPADSGP